VKLTPFRQKFVFISYASADKADADAIVTVLEGSGLRCWIAPRNIPEGADWPEAIPDAIGQCRLFLLVFSRTADQSDAVFRELALAAKRKKIIFYVRIRPDVPKRTAFFLEPVQWSDAFDRPLNGYKTTLVEALRKQIRRGRVLTFYARIRESRAWTKRTASVAIVAVVMSLLLQLFFYAAGTALLQGAAYWLVLAVCGLIAWGLQHFWNSLKRRKEPAS
jgi:hypothetical protein